MRPSDISEISQELHLRENGWALLRGGASLGPLDGATSGWCVNLAMKANFRFGMRNTAEKIPSNRTVGNCVVTLRLPTVSMRLTLSHISAVPGTD